MRGGNPAAILPFKRVSASFNVFLVPMLNWIGEKAFAKPFRTLNDMFHDAEAMRFFHSDSQPLARQFNDDEEVCSTFESR